MKICVLLLLCLGALASAENRVKRQASYTFPGPRVAQPRQAVAAYHPQQQPRPSRAYAEEPEDPNLYQPAPRRPSYQPGPQHVSAPARSHSPPPQPAPQQPPPPPPTYEAPRPAPAPQPRQSYSPQPSPQRSRASSTNRANKYGSAPQQSLGNTAEEDEEDQGPDALTLLLEDSKFTCGGKGDGYYADDSVNCQVFHYCISGARHSWMCPEGTVFHQVHLNCVPDSQDICTQSQKFHFVNDYLYKPVDYDGPNNTARYAQRYYPDGYVVGDPLVSPHEAPSRPHAPPPPPPQHQQAPPPSYSRPATRVQSYPAPAPRQQPRQLAPPPPPQPQQPPPSYSVPAQPSYSVPEQPPTGYSPSAGPSRGSSRPSRPAPQSYPAEVPQGYRRSPPARIEPPPHSVPVEDDDDGSYQPETRRYAPGSPRSASGYAAPRQYRPVHARTAAAAVPVRQQYPTYASNQAAGVQYDEDY